MAVQKRYKVFVSQNGSPVVQIGEYAERELALDFAANQPDGTGYVVDVVRDTDPGIAGGMPREERRETKVR